MNQISTLFLKMKHRSLSKVVLIVTEGTNTEPDYFASLESAIRDFLNKEGDLLSHLAIEDEHSFFEKIMIEKGFEEAKKKTGKRKGVTKRQFENSNTGLTNLQEILIELYGKERGINEYEKNKAVPLRFVALAKAKEEQEQLYDEIWVVFDKNGHTAHKEAFKLANDGVQNKKINIAFSSRSFEYWILLHFERICKPFDKSECGVKVKGNKTIFDCGKENNANPKDCKGETCLVGYIRRHTLLKNYAKSNVQSNLLEMMKILLDGKYLLNAFENAAWLRFQMEKQYPTSLIHELNPYTNVDELVKSILGILTKILWKDFGQKFDFAGMKDVKISLLKDNTIEFSAKEISINPNTMKIYLKDKDRKISMLESQEKEFAVIMESNKFTIKLTDTFTKKDFCIEIGNEILMIEMK